MKKFKKISLVSICIPRVFLFLIISWEIFTIAVNNFYNIAVQKDELICAIRNAGDIEIIDTYSFVGNTGGTGNHCELLSAAVVRNKIGNTPSFYYAVDKTADYIWSLSEMQEFSYDEWSRRLDFPEDETNCYLLIKIDSAPFDNIQGQFGH